MRQLATPVSYAESPVKSGNNSLYQPLDLSTMESAIGGYSVILADPPWSWITWSNKGANRSAKKYYPVMELRDICALPVNSLSADNCYLFLWSISSMLPHAFSVIDAWGFKPVNVGFVWVKRNKAGGGFFMGMGYHTRQNAEFCLLATKGKPKRKSAKIHQIIDAPRREHSRKPDEIYERIEEGFEGPYLELFSRTKREGWSQWGLDSGRWEA
jgi:N6-adenosine-specific RNA methylase IME4